MRDDINSNGALEIALKGTVDSLKVVGSPLNACLVCTGSFSFHNRVYFSVFPLKKVLFQLIKNPCAQAAYDVPR